ncbi:MAG: radical SAM protein [Spirochaetales bacterium]|nr:radical SAM protein [Spirochaetales bacterium]
MLLESKYNTIVMDEGEMILYNSFSGSIVKFGKEYQTEVYDILNGNDKYRYDSEVVKYLYDNKFISHSHEDQKNQVEVMRLEKIVNNNLHIIIMPTEQCNFRCSYCYESFIGKKMNEDTQNGIIEFIRRNVHYYRGLHISWYGGEPLLALDVIKNISEKAKQICKNSRRTFTTSITTNGFLLTLETFKKLQKYNLVNVQITLDGLMKTHDQQRKLANGEPTFTTILENLLEIKNNIKSAIQRIIIRTNVTKEIYDQFDEYLKYYGSIFNSDSRFTFLIRPAGDWGGEAVKEISSELMDYNEFNHVYQKIINSKYKINVQFFEDFLQPTGSVCSAGLKNQFLIRSDGRVNKCTCILDDDENQIGYLQDNGVMILDDDKYCNWISYEQRQECHECYLYGACLGSGCPVRVKNKKLPRACGFEKMYIKDTLIMLNRCGHVKAY